MWSRSELKSKAKESFKRNYWKAVLVAFFLLIVSGGIGANYTFNSNHSYFTGSNNGGFSNDFAETKQSLDANSFKELMNNTMQKIDEPSRVAVIVVAIVVIMAIILIVVAIGIAIDTFLINPLKVGIKRFFVQDLDHKAFVGELAYGFDSRYKNIVVTMFFKNLSIFLWTLLFIIPGIVKAYEYRMIDYILTDNSDLDRHAAFALSKEMMSGQKWNAFVLDLSFIGWGILGLITFGIVNIFYVAPYQYHTNAALYSFLKTQTNNGTIQQVQ